MSNRNKNHYLHSHVALGRLGRIAESAIQNNQVLLSRLLNEEEKKYKQGDMYTFDDIDRKYNAEISDDEKRAWVWHKRKLGVSMTGWEKYLVSDKISESKDKIQVFTNKKTIVKDNHFRDIAEVQAGVFVGYATKFELPYDKDIYLVVTTHEGNKQYFNKRDVEVKGNNQAKRVPDAIKELVKTGAMFYSKENYLPFPYFVFGNMYDREKQLRKDKDFIVANYGKDVFENHLKVIQNAKPPLLSVQSANPNDRPIILAFSEIAVNTKKMYVTELREDTGIPLKDIINDSDWKAYPWANSSRRAELRSDWRFIDNDGQVEYRLSLQDAFKFWLATLPNSDFVTVSRQNIEKYYIDKTNFSKLLSEQEKDTISAEAPRVGELLFARFLHEALTFEDQQKLDYTFNSIYNAFADVNANRVPIGFSCSAYFKTKRLGFSEAQRQAVSYMEVANSGIIAYDVGVGKTMSAILSLANGIQEGKYKRPLLVVPNQTYKKWLRELIGYQEKDGMVYGVLTGTDIVVNEFYNLGVNQIKEVNGKMYVGKTSISQRLPEKSITVVTFEGFKKLGLADTEDAFAEMNKIVEQKDAYMTEKERAAFLLSTQEKFNKVNKDSVVDLQTLGIDQITIDEAHAAKNVFETVKAKDGAKRYQIGSGSSDFGIKAFFFCNHVIRETGGNIMLLTATPFSNSPLEIFSMVSLVGYKTIKQMGYNNLFDFMTMFVMESQEYVNKLDGSIEMDYVVKSYINRQILQKLINRHILYKTGEDAGVLRPKKVNLPKLKKIDSTGLVVSLPREEQILTYIAQTPEQAEIQADVEYKIREIKDSMGDSKSPYTLGDIGKMLNLNLSNALSPYLINIHLEPTYKQFVEESPKINYVVKCIESVKKQDEANGNPVSGQVIYCNRAVAYFPLIVEYLNKEVGYKQGVLHNGRKFNEVEQIHAKMSKERVESIKDAFLANVVKVVIGTATIREGIDLQSHSSCLYILTPTWNPTDITQVEGRIWRQGNKFKGVRVVMPLIQDSMDIFVFQKLEEKTARINDIWFKATRGNVLNQESLDPEEIKMALFSKIEPLIKMRLEYLSKENERKLSLANTSLEALTVYRSRFSNYTATKQIILVGFAQFQKELEYLINSVKSKMAYISDEDRKAEKKMYAKRLLPLYDTLLEANIETIDDKSIVKIVREFLSVIKLSKINRNNSFNITYQGTNYNTEYRLGIFLEMLSSVKKTERDLLSPRGYTSENVPELIKEVEAELIMLKFNNQYLTTQNARQEAETYVMEIKAKYIVEATDIETRVDDFASLNYMLTEFEPTLQKQPEPEPEATPEPDQSEADKARKRRIRIALAKAKALLILLKINKN